MAVSRVEDLVAFQRAVALRRGAHALVRQCTVQVDFKWRSQVFDAILSVESNIAEGWTRSRHGEMAQFLRYAHGSLDEAWRRLLDGADNGYYPMAALDELRVHERVCGAALRRLRTYLETTPDP